MFFNDAMAITKEDNFKRKAIHDAILAEQKGMGDISCDDEEFERRMDADKEKGMAEYKNGDPEWKRRTNARVELASHRLLERMRRTDEEWQQIERERPSGINPSGSESGKRLLKCKILKMRQADQERKRLDKTLPHWIGMKQREPLDWLCHKCQSILPHPPCSTCPVACHGSLGDVHEVVMTSIEATHKAEFYCAQCDLDLNCAEDYAAHMAGKYHKNRVPNLPIPNIDAMDLMHVMDLGIGSMLISSSSSSSSSK